MNKEPFTRKARRYGILFGALAILLLVFCASLNQAFLANSGYSIKNLAEMTKKTDSGNSVTFDFFSKNCMDKENVTACAEKNGSLSNDLNMFASGIKITLIDQNYSTVYPKQMLDGSFPDARAIEEGRKYIVISEEVSNRLFQSVQTVGSKVFYNNQTFIVTGVYKNSRSAFWTLLGDGFDRGAFIPYSSVKGGSETGVDTIAFKGYPGLTTDYAMTVVRSYSLSSYRITDYSDATDSFNRVGSWVLFVFGIIAILYILTFLVRYLASWLKRMRNKAKDHYLPGLLRAEWKSVLLSAAIVLSGIALMVWIGSRIRIEISIPQKYMPDDNLFDFKFYFEQILADIKEKNTVVDTFHTCFQYLFSNILWINQVCSACVLVFTTVSFLFFKLTMEQGVDSLARLGGHSISILVMSAAGVIAGAILSLALVSGVALPVGIVILICFFAMKMMLRFQKESIYL